MGDNTRTAVLAAALALGSAMFCTSCATRHPAIVDRCAVCGSHLTPSHLGATVQPPTAHSHALQVASPPTRHQRRSWALRLLYVVPIACLLFGSWWIAADRRGTRAEAAGWYAAASRAAAAGLYHQAATSFAAAGGYRDAGARRRAAESDLAPFRAAYLEGGAALDAGDPDAAIARLLPVVRQLPDYGDAASMLADARRQRAEDLRTAVAAAEARRDWVAAEQTLLDLIEADPGDTAAVAHLQQLRRDHAPLVFGRGRALWLAGPDGADERLITDQVPALLPSWSPDRTQIAFMSTDPDDPAASVALYVVGADGSGLRRLADDLSAHTPPVWSPDGRRLAYTSFAGYDTERRDGVIGVRIVDVGTGVETTLTSPDQPVAFNPSWSPDGDRLALVSKHPALGERPQNAAGDVLLVDLASGETTDLTRGRISDVWSVAWSPAGDHLLTYSLFGDTWYEPPITSIKLLDLPRDSISEAQTDGGLLSAPVWSPDGQRFAFVEDQRVVRVHDGPAAVASFESDNELGGEITWAADSNALLATNVDSAKASLLLSLATAPALDVRPLALQFDDDQPFFGAPQWAPLNAAPIPAPPSVSGTGLDPSP